MSAPDADNASDQVFLTVDEAAAMAKLSPADVASLALRRQVARLQDRRPRLIRKSELLKLVVDDKPRRKVKAARR